jgi:hypothetical protein
MYTKLSRIRILYREINFVYKKVVEKQEKKILN